MPQLSDVHFSKVKFEVPRCRLTLELKLARKIPRLIIKTPESMIGRTDFARAKRGLA